MSRFVPTSIHLIKSRDAHNAPCYFVLRATQSNLARLKAKKDQTADLSHFGEILASGFGDIPTPTVRKQLEQQYGITLSS